MPFSSSSLSISSAKSSGFLASIPPMPPIPPSIAEKIAIPPATTPPRTAMATTRRISFGALLDDDDVTKTGL